MKHALTTLVLALVLVPRVARTDDAFSCWHGPTQASCATRPPTMFDLTHRYPELMLETTHAAVTSDSGTSLVRVDRLSFEMPIVPLRWYVGVAWDGAIGSDDNASPRFIPGNPELWGRGVWTAAYGLSFGGGLSLVIPTTYTNSTAALPTSNAAIAVRGWDQALFATNDVATLRPSLDVRLVTGPVTVHYRQTLEIASNFGDVSFRFAAVGTLFFGVRFSKLVSAGADLIEYYSLDPDPKIPDDQRPYFAVGAHVSLDTRYFRPSMGFMTNIGSPLDAISRIGAPLTRAPTSFVGAYFSLDFPILGRKNTP